MNKDIQTQLENQIQEVFGLEGDAIPDLVNLIHILMKKRDKQLIVKELRDIYDSYPEESVIENFVSWFWDLYKLDEQEDNNTSQNEGKKSPKRKNVVGESANVPKSLSENLKKRQNSALSETEPASAGKSKKSIFERLIKHPKTGDDVNNGSKISDQGKRHIGDHISHKQAARIIESNAHNLHKLPGTHRDKIKNSLNADPNENLSKKVKIAPAENDAINMLTHDQTKESKSSEEENKGTASGPGNQATATSKTLPPKKRCKHWPNCKDEKKCPFYHPKETCMNFPDCPYGDNCFYIHPAIPCKFGASCIRPNCAFTHPRMSRMAYGYMGGYYPSMPPKMKFHQRPPFKNPKAFMATKTDQQPQKNNNHQDANSLTNNKQESTANSQNIDSKSIENFTSNQNDLRDDHKELTAQRFTNGNDDDTNEKVNEDEQITLDNNKDVK